MLGVKVCKFGGTSVANTDQITKVGRIIRKDSTRKVIVVSAPAGITDMLYRAYRHKDDPFTFEHIFDGIRERFYYITKDLPTSPQTATFVKYFLLGLKTQITTTPDTSMTEDYFVSRGEYLNAMIIADYLGYQFIDAQDIIFLDTNNNSAKVEVDWPHTEEMVDKILLTNLRHGVVVPGFYGTIFNGPGVKTFSRGGSDVTGAILAKALNASVYENWTDVQGLHTADPRIIPNAKHVREVTYDEMRELAYSGTLILHPDAILPVKEKDIPINIRNTNAPNDPGTIVTAKKTSSEAIVGIAHRPNFIAFSIKKVGMNDEIGFIRSITEIFENEDINIEHTPSSIDRFSIIVRINEVKGKIKKILDEIIRICNSELKSMQDSIEISNDLSLITVVGENMAYTPGIIGRIFTACGNSGINIRMVTQDLGEMNIIFGVETQDEHKAVKAVYEEFFNESRDNWMVVILKDGEDTIVSFGNKTEAEEYRNNLSAQGISSYLCKVEKTPQKAQTRLFSI